MRFYDFYLKAENRAAMDEALHAGGFITVTITDEDETITKPAEGVSIDRIGPITRVLGYEEDGETPITEAHPEYHVNLRCRTAPTAEQEAEIEAIKIVPPDAPYRVWA